MFWVLVMLLACAPAGNAGQRPAKKAPAAPKAAAVPATFPIESITVEGNQNYSREQIIGIAGLHLGQLAAPKDFEAARDRLVAAGVFETIDFRYAPGPGGKGYALVFQVKEAGPLFPVQFEELGVPDAQLIAALKRADPLFGAKIPATQSVLERYAKALEEYLASQNRKNKVMGSLSPLDTGQMAVVFRPAAQLPVVAFVKFTNNQVLPATALQNKINPIAVGMAYREPRFRQWLEANVRPLYEARGRLRVTFPEVHAEKAPDVKGLIVTVKVEEGESYSLGDVQIAGPGIPAAELLKAADIKTGDLADFDRVQAGVGRVEQVYRRQGYMKVSSRQERKIDDKAKTVAVTIHMEPGPQYLFGKLTIQGLDLNAEAAVRKLWSLKEGARFNVEYPDYFLQQVQEGGFFDNLGKTKAVLDTNDETRTVNVTLVFSGAPPAPPDRFRPR